MSEQNVLEIYRELKSTAERDEFVSIQHRTILGLLKKSEAYEEEITHLKQLLISSTPLIGEAATKPFVISPEEELIETQITMLKDRGTGANGAELELEDVKKLDLLLKNKNTIQMQIEASKTNNSKTLISTNELLNIVRKLPSPPKGS